MLKKYAVFLMLGPVSNALWAWWALPAINEQGTLEETIQWICVQALAPALFSILLLFRVQAVYWLMVIYSGFIILFAVGMLGWALIGFGVPASVYVVCAVFFIMGFGMLFHSLKDLNVGQKARHYGLED